MEYSFSILEVRKDNPAKALVSVRSVPPSRHRLMKRVVSAHLWELYDSPILSLVERSSIGTFENEMPFQNV